MCQKEKVKIIKACERLSSRKSPEGFTVRGEIEIMCLWKHFEETVSFSRKLALREEQEEDIDRPDKCDERNEKIRKWHANPQKGTSAAISWCNEDTAINLEAKKLTLRCGCEAHGDKYCFHKKWECYTCNKEGHLGRHCEFITNAASKAINKGAKVNGNGGNKKNIVLAVTTVNNMVINRVFKIALTSLILDSGATVHSVANKGMFTDFTGEISTYQTSSQSLSASPSPKSGGFLEWIFIRSLTGIDDITPFTGCESLHRL